MSFPESARTFIRANPIAFALVSVALLLAIAAVVALAAASRAVKQADDHARRTQATFAAANQLIATVNDAAAAVLRHVANVGPAELRAYERARGEYPGILEALRPPATRRAAAVLFEELQAAVQTEFLALDRALVAHQREGPSAAIAVVGAEGNRALLDDIRQLVASLQRASFEDYARLAAGGSQRARVIQLLQVGVIAVAIAVIAAAVGLLLRHMRQGAHWVTVCSWTRRVRWRGRWVPLEDYLSGQFNVHCTHGICDEAAAKLRADAAKYDEAAEHA